MRYFIISGEASGDLHASNLVRAMLGLDATLKFRGWGGDLMAAQGVEVTKHYRDLAFMGFAEVLMNLRTIMQNFSLCKADIAAFSPDAVILVDYPGFNLRMAAWLKKQGIPVFYYISPQVWAWKQSRVHKIKRYVDKMLVILPFEKPFYERFGYTADFVGHPLLDAIERHTESLPNKTSLLREFSPQGKPLVALLPGSRKQEVSVMLPVMLEMSRKFPDCQFVVSEASSLDAGIYDELCSGFDVSRLKGRTYDLLSVATAAAVTSGTASLEAALFGVPEVICYKANYFSYQIARRIIKIRFIGLANLIMDRSIIRELIQDDFNTKNLIREMERLLRDDAYREGMMQDLNLLKVQLGGPGASARAAALIMNYHKEMLAHGSH